MTDLDTVLGAFYMILTLYLIMVPPIFFMMTVIYHKLFEKSPHIKQYLVIRHFKEIKINKKRCAPLNKHFEDYVLIGTGKQRKRSGDWVDCTIEINVEKEFYDSVKVGDCPDFSERIYPISIIEQTKSPHKYC